MSSLGDFFNQSVNPGNIAGGTPLGGILNNPKYYDPGNISGDSTPQYTKPTMDPGSQAVVSQIQNGLLTNAQGNANKIMAGTGAAAGVQDVSGAQAQEQASEGGGGIPGMQQAISNKAAKNFAPQQARLQQNANLQGQMMTNQNMTTAATNSIALAGAAEGVQSQINNFQLQANAAQYQTISSLMSGAGKVAGAKAGLSNPNNANAQYLDSSESSFSNPASGGIYGDSGSGDYNLSGAGASENSGYFGGSDYNLGE